MKLTLLFSTTSVLLLVLPVNAMAFTSWDSRSDKNLHLSAKPGSEPDKKVSSLNRTRTTNQIRDEKHSQHAYVGTNQDSLVSPIASRLSNSDFSGPSEYSEAQKHQEHKSQTNAITSGNQVNTESVLRFMPQKSLNNAKDMRLSAPDTFDKVEKDTSEMGSLPDSKAVTDQNQANDDYGKLQEAEGNLGKLRQIQERSDVLIERLCDIHSKKKQLCYSEHGVPKCYCTGGLADCSGKKYAPNMSYAPKLPSNIKCLKFTYNNVKHFTDSYFANVSDFLVVDFSNNNLETVSQQTFARFTNLQYLILNHNVLSYKYLKPVMQYPPKLRLDLMDVSLDNIPVDFFYHYGAMPTSQIYMDFNHMPKLELKEFAWLDNLRYLSLTNSSIQTFVTAPMPKLQVLDLENNYISVFPDTCNTTSSDPSVFKSESLGLAVPAQKSFGQRKVETKSVSLFPSLSQLTLSSNVISNLPPPDKICLPALNVLSMESNNISEIPDMAFTTFHSLEVLELDRMKYGISKVGRSPFNISVLASLHISRNKINFSSPDINKDLFMGCTRLKVLAIDRNNLTGVTESKFEDMFRPLSSVESLYLGRCGMTYVPVKAFSELKSLLYLYIYVNNIKIIPPMAFDDMLSLRGIYMNENQISTIKQNAFSEMTIKRLHHINLSDNHFLCNCDLLWFQSWLNNAGPDLFMYYDNYKCSDRPNVSVQKFKLSVQACLLSRQTYILFVICFSIFITFFFAFVLVYRYRWHIRLMMYERRAPARVREQLLEDNQEQFRYDLFIVYGNDDCEWVEDILLPILEERWKLRTCIHQRDFIAGGSIIDNIVDTMNSSRQIMVVISSRFALSKWCNFELQLCQSHVITHDLPSLLVIKLDDIEPRDMSAAMFALYNTTCFLEWPSANSNSQDMKLFWQRLRKSLKILIENRETRTLAHHGASCSGLGNSDGEREHCTALTEMKGACNYGPFDSDEDDDATSVMKVV